jgi:hypothetical protein
VSEQILTINGRVNSKCQECCGEDAEDHTADEAPPPCDQPQSWYRCAGDREDDGSSEAALLPWCRTRVA